MNDRATRSTSAGDNALSKLIREHVRHYFQGHHGTLPAPGVYARLLPLIEKPLIEVTLEAVEGNRLKAAAILGINRNTLHKKIRDLGISVAPKPAKKL